ncbi:MAG: branched-chain amino acid aminotransferase [Propionibacteriaceae bacterium]|jgi:branched-chain amino acid aminotransferase|nr:branched-chain amino acid aminotransferase [Propionibacteriaceae bacterium]
MEYPLTPNPRPASAADLSAIHANPGFGEYLTDHMVVATWKKGEGWVDDAVVPYGPFQMNPAAAVLHYAQEVFEGMKAYRWSDGSIWTFRPEENARRFNKSAARMMLPQIPEADFITAVRRLVEVDAAWVPEPEGEKSLYIRPFMFASESFLGVRAAETVTFCVIASPVAPYFAGPKPVDIWVTDKYSRAGEGGTGEAKCGGNYAASLIAQYEGYEYGCSQVLFIEAVGKDRVEELGGMNLMLITSDGKLYTPQLSGTILDGITRKSVLQVAADLLLEPVEARLTKDFLFDKVLSGEVVEAFSCGTAAVIAPISSFKSVDGEFPLREPVGERTVALRNRLIDIQYGRTPDTHDWMVKIV